MRGFDFKVMDFFGVYSALLTSHIIFVILRALNFNAKNLMQSMNHQIEAFYDEKLSSLIPPLWVLLVSMHNTSDGSYPLCHCPLNLP